MGSRSVKFWLSFLLTSTGLFAQQRPWDIAALQSLIEEAGGKATTLAGERSIYRGSLVTTNGLLHAEALALLAS